MTNLFKHFIKYVMRSDMPREWIPQMIESTLGEKIEMPEAPVKSTPSESTPGVTNDVWKIPVKK